MRRWFMSRRTVRTVKDCPIGVLIKKRVLAVGRKKWNIGEKRGGTREGDPAQIA